MQNTKYIKINPIIVIAVILEAIFIILAIVAINNIITEKQKVPTIEISDYSEVNKSVPVDTSVDGISEDHQEVISNELYNIVTLNNSGNVPNSGATIRQNSVKSVYVPTTETLYMTFLVDIDDLGQSYRVAYKTSNKERNYDDEITNESPVLVYCPKASELIHEDFNCKDGYNNKGESKLLYDAVRYKVFSNFTVGLIGDLSKGEALSIHINTQSDDESVKNAAINELSDYLKQLDINLEDYEYSASAYQCCSL